MFELDNTYINDRLIDRETEKEIGSSIETNLNGVLGQGKKYKKINRYRQIHS